MRQKHLMLLTTLIAITESCMNTTECDKNTKSKVLIDTAMNLLKKAKEGCVKCPTPKPADCEELLSSGCYKSGSYVIWLKNRVIGSKSLDVYCDMDTDGGGWTVIQRRGNFSRPRDYFYRDWSSYKSGFGNIEKDFWLGNDNIFSLTHQDLYSVRFDLKSVDGEKKYALYDTFWIDDEINKYTLHIKDYSGDAGDSMATHNNMPFSTKDVKNTPQEDCAQQFKGAWWYNKCHRANLNGLYLRGKHESFADGVNWYHFKGHRESLATTEIKIRSKSFKNKNAK